MTNIWTKNFTSNNEHNDNLIKDETARELETLTNNIPGGVAKVMLDDNFTILFANDGFYNLTGYSREEYLGGHIQNKGINLIVQDDIDKINRTLKEQIENNKPIQIEYRIIKKDGSIAWISVNGTPVAIEDNMPIVQAVFMDITQSKEAQELLEFEKERYKIISELSEEVIFEYSIPEDLMVHSQRFKRVFSKEASVPHFVMEMRNSDLIYEDDKEDFWGVFENFNKAKPSFLVEVRIKNDNDEYNWFEVHGVHLFDNNGKPLKIIGKTSNINEKKKETESLRQKAQRDPLTWLYNKTVSQSLVSNYIQPKIDGHSGAFLFIDIDNFKAVNDNLGHMFGDQVLKDISSKVMALFRSSDIVGRIGGDEFIVFIKDIKDKDHIITKANAICDVFRSAYMGENVKYKISGSIGISMYPQDGETYEELFKKADSALYSAKNLGKDRYEFYHSGIKDVHYLKGGNIEKKDKIRGTIFQPAYDYSLISTIFEILYQTKDMNNAINIILRMIGMQYDVSHVYIFENSEDDEFVSNTYQWCAEREINSKEMYQNIPCDKKLDYKLLFNEEGILYCSDLKGSNSQLKDIFTNSKLKSVLQCAIYDNGKYRGYIGFGETKENRMWVKTEIEFLNYIAKILSVFLIKMRAQDKIILEGTINKIIGKHQNLWNYVINKDSYKLIYISEKTLEKKPDAKIGDKCFSAIMYDRETPCPFCPITKLNNEDKSVYFEGFDKEFNGYIGTTAYLIKWVDNSDAILLSSMDITRYKNS